MVKQSDYQIPFDKNGNQLHYPYGYSDVEKWKDNYVFEDEIKFINLHRFGVSSVYAQFESTTTGKKFTMFTKDLSDCFNDFVNGKLKATFTFCKRGQNYGIKVVK